MINLDSMTDAEVRAAAAVFNELADYAHKKSVAMTYRRQGDILMAEKYESLCAMIYFQLPKWARW